MKNILSLLLIIFCYFIFSILFHVMFLGNAGSGFYGSNNFWLFIFGAVSVYFFIIPICLSIFIKKKVKYLLVFFLTIPFLFPFLSSTYLFFFTFSLILGLFFDFFLQKRLSGR